MHSTSSVTCPSSSSGMVAIPGFYETLRVCARRLKPKTSLEKQWDRTRFRLLDRPHLGMVPFRSENGTPRWNGVDLKIESSQIFGTPTGANRTRPRCARISWLSAVDWTFCKDRGLARLESWLSTDEASRSWRTTNRGILTVCPRSSP